VKLCENDTAGSQRDSNGTFSANLSKYARKRGVFGVKKEGRHATAALPKMGIFNEISKSGRLDLNQRPLEPHSSGWLLWGCIYQWVMNVHIFAAGLQRDYFLSSPDIRGFCLRIFFAGMYKYICSRSKIIVRAA
jgi:hypothetical protein